MTATANRTYATTAPASSFSLTRRGRLLLVGMPALVAAALLLAAVIVAGAALFNQAQASTAEVGGVEAVEVTVAPGDTLWSIASAATSETDIQQLITQISELNDLDSAQLAPGQVLFVPAH